MKFCKKYIYVALGMFIDICTWEKYTSQHTPNNLYQLHVCFMNAYNSWELNQHSNSKKADDFAHHA